MLEFTAAEQSLVLETFREHARELLTEINHTDSRDYRADLLAKSTLLEGVIHKLEQAQAVAKA